MSLNVSSSTKSENEIQGPPPHTHPRFEFPSSIPQEGKRAGLFNEQIRQNDKDATKTQEPCAQCAVSSLTW